MKRLVLLLSLLAIIVALVACTEQTQSADASGAPEGKQAETAEVSYPLTLKDSAGNDVVIEAAPQRVVSLAPSITETIYALGGDQLLVGRTDYCMFPSEVQDKPSVGSIIEPDVEAVLALEPEIIIAQSIFVEETLQKFTDAGIKVLSFKDPQTIEDVLAGIKNVGKAINRTEQAEEITQAIQEKITQVSDAVKDETPTSVYYAVSFGEFGDYTATGDTFVNEILKAAGGDNVAKDGTNWSYDREQLIAKDPDVVLVADEFDNKENFSKDPAYSVLKAVGEDRVVAIDKNVIEIPGPRVGDAVEMIAKILYPDAF